MLNSTYISPSIKYYMEQLSAGSSFKIDNIYFATNLYEINQVSGQVITEFIITLGLISQL